MNKIIVELLENKISEYSFAAKSRLNLIDDYPGDMRFKELAYDELKERSKYKRALKEYKQTCDFVMKEKYKNAIKIYRKHPDKFIEEVYGIKLMPYQKILVRMMWKRKGKVC